MSLPGSMEMQGYMPPEVHGIDDTAQGDRHLEKLPQLLAVPPSGWVVNLERVAQPLGGAAGTIVKFRAILLILSILLFRHPKYAVWKIRQYLTVVQRYGVVRQATVMTTTAKKQYILSLQDKETIIGVGTNEC